MGYPHNGDKAPFEMTTQEWLENVADIEYQKAYADTFDQEDNALAKDAALTRAHKFQEAVKAGKFNDIVDGRA